MSNIALQQPTILWDRRGKEIINGNVVAMTPARPNHWRVSKKISSIFDNFFQDKSCEVFCDVPVHLSKKNKVAPDISVVCNPEFVKENGIHGVPDLVVEVLSPSTAARDKVDKKNLYERFGVKEYWIIDTKSRMIEIYVLENDKYSSASIYIIHEEFDLQEMTEQEKASVITKFKTSLFDDLVIDINEVFKDLT
ncbi:MAG: Uma2 family endonuclease [Defluviitaleaceae bacterium]|nr:Uma2 family endonuclease [Defluviitaleaceae bacterium]